MPKKNLKICVIHGPNLNLLGQREKNIYGSFSLDEINKELTSLAKELKVEISFFQSNHEGELVTQIQEAQKDCDGILMNPAAYTHTSIAIRDSILGTKMPVVEVHLSNIYQREEFRHHSLIAPVAIGQIAGFGAQSYFLGLQALVNFLQTK